jgi:hypothetical protein
LSRIPSLLALALLAAGAPARGEAVLDVAGSVVSVAPRLEVRVVVRNRGDRAAAPVEIVGELLGERQEARLADGVAPGAEDAVVLAFTPSSSFFPCLRFVARTLMAAAFAASFSTGGNSQTPSGCTARR